MDSAYKEGNEQTDMPACKLQRLEGDELALPFGQNFEEDLSEFMNECPSAVRALVDNFTHTSNPSVARPRPEKRMSRNSKCLQRRQILLEHSSFSESSDSDESEDDLKLLRLSPSTLLNQRMKLRRPKSALRFNYPSRRSISSGREASCPRLRGCESKSGPVCLMGDRVVIQPRGADIDMVCYYPTGMINPTGTLCYMNSVLQAMGVLPLFAVGVALHSPDLELSLLNALRELYEKMWRPSELDPPQQERPHLDSKAVRTFVRHNSKLFPEHLEHDVEELFLYFIDTLERETASLGLGAGDSNLITRIFNGWTQLPGTTQREHFYSLRLAVHDDRIHSVKDALFTHLSGKLIQKGEQNKAGQSESRDKPSIPRKRRHSKFSVSIDSLNANTSFSEELNYTKHDSSSPDIVSSKVEDDCLVPGSRKAFEHSASPPPVPQMVIQPPEVLCLCLDRNYIDHDEGSVVYDARPIVVDEEIVISTTYLPQGTPKPLTYQLRSVISYRYHSWGSGHYVAGTRLRKGLWAMCDDCTLTTAARASMGDLASFMHFYVRVS